MNLINPQTFDYKNNAIPPESQGRIALSKKYSQSYASLPQMKNHLLSPDAGTRCVSVPPGAGYTTGGSTGTGRGQPTATRLKVRSITSGMTNILFFIVLPPPKF
jgi:hypothetical protein